MNISRTIFAALGVIALAGIASNASAKQNNFRLADPGQNAKTGKVLDECQKNTCLKVIRRTDGSIKIILRDVGADSVKFFIVSFKDDATGKFVSRRVESEDGTKAVLDGLIADGGKKHTFIVKKCFEDRCSKNERKFSFRA